MEYAHRHHKIIERIGRFPPPQHVARTRKDAARAGFSEGALFLVLRAFIIGSQSMAITTLDHYTINVLELDTTLSFYVEVLGFENGERPPFSFPGAWLYCEGRPVVHLIGDKAPGGGGAGAIDHVAFRAGGLDDFLRRLDDRGVPYSERDVPGGNIHQVFLNDPNGISVEICFPSDETQ